MVDGLDVEQLRPLFEVPPSGFVAARNTLAKQLRAAKQREAATLVAAVRRPRWVDWALNQVATNEPDLIADFLATAAALRDAQAASIEGREGPDLRDTMAALRGSIAAVSRSGAAALRRSARAPDAAELGARLGEVAAHPAAGEQLRAGILGSADPGGDDLFAGLIPAERPRAGPDRAATDQHPTRPARRQPARVDDTGEQGRPALRAVDGGRRSSPPDASRRTAERMAVKERMRARAPLAKQLDAAVRRRSVAAEKLEAARRALLEAEAAMAEAETVVDEAATRLAELDASPEPPAP